MNDDVQSPIADQVHINSLRRALWSGPTYGRAAVMVGAGFSLNAVPIEPGANSFPTWSALIRTLIGQLTSDISTSDITNTLMDESKSTSGALRLSQEFVDLHDRVHLDNLIKDSIPDTRYEPSDLHRLLLELPWSDIFTTNWDTLLERAANDVYSRRYECLLTMDDIPLAHRPRLVKLHGSFPSNRPFILTEDDFRKYPTDFAPFVNLVQQSMMENVFCLIGFSGDDPNFLAWSGWIRDNLGEQRPNIYLVGLLNLRSGQRRMLEKRKITPIDLSEIFRSGRSDHFSSGQRYALAYRWFIRNLMQGQPSDVLKWPDRSKPDETDPELSNLVPIPRNNAPSPFTESMFPNTST